ncbi:hypothetical protein HMPREF2141_01396 [Bacteroides uniformis]|nr:hypothetical protein HMPREF2141_01396 [Bacteroides uniformis]
MANFAISPKAKSMKQVLYLTASTVFFGITGTTIPPPAPYSIPS